MPPTGLSRPQGRPGDDHLTLNVSVTTRWRPLDTECFSDDQVTTTWHWMPHWRPGDDHLTLNVSVTTRWRPLDTECFSDDHLTLNASVMTRWRPLDTERHTTGRHPKDHLTYTRTIPSCRSYTFLSFMVLYVHIVSKQTWCLTST